MRISFGTNSITKRSKTIIEEILDSGRVSIGKYVRLFEKDFARVIVPKKQ